MKVSYFSRSIKPDIEAKGCKWLPLENLLQDVDIISIHLPKNTTLLNADHFKLLANNKILINTTLGISFEKEAFINWLQQNNNYAIMDRSGMGIHAAEFSQLDRFISTPKISGFTSEAKDRLSQKVIENMKEYLKVEK
jgi:lactate dehydrogenase-like 2-hydroxyacid dehydrogenase